MSTNPNLFGERVVSPPGNVNEITQASLAFDRERDIQANFEKFHAENPQVYTLLVKYARQAKAAGRKRFSIKSIYERMRWYMTVEAEANGGFKLNDHYTSRYARLIMQQEEDLVDFFELRELKNGVVQ